MKKTEYLGRLRQELKLRSGALFKTQTIRNGNQIVLEISSKLFKKNFDRVLDENKEVPDAEQRLFNTVNIICELIAEIIFSEIKNDMKKIANVCSKYLLKNRDSILKPLDIKEKCDKHDLWKMSSYVFIDRISGYFKTLCALSDLPGHNILLTHELSIGIILRSCILDCLIINAWIRDKSRNQKFIRDMVVSSFLMVPAGVSQNIKLEFKTIAN